MSEPFRILHVIDSFDLGGAQEALINLVAFADREKFAPEVATMHGRGVYWEKFRALGVPVHSLSPHKFFPLYFWRLTRLFVSKKFDAVHCHLIAANLVAKPLAALCRVRVRLNHDQANDAYRQRNKARLALDRVANRFFSTHILAVSASIVEFLIKFENVPREKISLVHNAIDLRRFTPSPERRAELRREWKLPLDAPVIAGIGRLNYQKNFSLFLDIAADIARTHPRAIFVIAGSGPEEAMLRERALALGLRANVRFLGFVADTVRLYDAVDFLLMSSRFEGLPMTLLEAMAMRVPVVASRLDGIAEIIDENVDGLLAAPNAKDEFCAHLRALLDDPQLATSLAENAFQKVTRDFSAEKMTRKIEALYERFLA